MEETHAQIDHTQEAVTEQVTPEQVAPEQEIQETVSSEVEQPQESSNEKNIRELRLKAERADKLQRERDEAFALLKKIDEQARIYQEQQQKKTQAVEDDDELDTEDYTPRSYVDKRYKNLESKLSTYERRMQEAEVEQQLKAQYADFNEVVSPQNIAMLRESYPEIAASIAANADLGTKAKSAYTVIKKLGIHTEDNFSSDRKRAETNANKPRPSNAISSQQGNSPLNKANAFASGLTEDLKKQLYKEMMEARSN